MYFYVNTVLLFYLDSSYAENTESILARKGSSLHHRIREYESEIDPRESPDLIIEPWVSFKQPVRHSETTTKWLSLDATSKWFELGRLIRWRVQRQSQNILKLTLTDTISHKTHAISLHFTVFFNLTSDTLLLLMYILSFNFFSLTMFQTCFKISCKFWQNKHTNTKISSNVWLDYSFSLV